MTIEIGCVLLILGFHQESYFNMFESDNKMKIYLCRLLLENTLSQFSLLLSLGNTGFSLNQLVNWSP